MSGERLDLPRCNDVAVGVGRHVRRGEVAVMDVGALLPKQWEPVSGVISVQTLEHTPFTLDLAHNTLVLETSKTIRKRTAAMKPLTFRACRPGGGAVLDLFVAVDTASGPLWMILDSGNMDRVMVDPLAAPLLGVKVLKAKSAPRYKA